MVKKAAWITPSGKWKFTIERSGRRCGPNCGPTNPWRPITKELNEFLERGNFWGSLPNYWTVSLQASRKSLFATNGSVSRPVAFLEGIWIRQQFRRPPLGARANGGIIFGFPWLRRTRFRRLYRRSRVPRGTCGLGFKETERVVYFLKDLNPIDRP